MKFLQQYFKYPALLAYEPYTSVSQLKSLIVIAFEKLFFFGLSKTWQISFPYRRYYVEYDLTFLHNLVSSLQVPRCPECSLMCKSILPLIDRLTHLEFYTFLSTHHYLTIAISGLILKACPPYSCSWPVHVKAAFPKMALQTRSPRRDFPGERSLVHANLQVSLLQDLSGPLLC